MKIIIGLGNPGKRYENTRHNVGFKVLDRLSEKYETSFDDRRFESVLAKFFLDEKEILLVKPQTFMNASGNAARKIWSAFSEKITDYQDFLIVLDDSALPLGSLRFRQRGSSGGHRGLASILDIFESEDIPRLRVGIGAPKSEGSTPLEEYVLTRFLKGEKALLEQAIEKAADACICWVRYGAEDTMQRFNSKPNTLSMDDF